VRSSSGSWPEGRSTGARPGALERFAHDKLAAVSGPRVWLIATGVITLPEHGGNPTSGLVVLARGRQVGEDHDGNRDDRQPAEATEHPQRDNEREEGKQDEPDHAASFGS
jgi:hypothetical protein